MTKPMHSVRIRVSISQKLRERIQEVADVLGVPEFYVIGISIALGSRLLYWMAVEPPAVADRAAMMADLVRDVQGEPGGGGE